MGVDIDCLIIGSNEIEFSEYEKTMRLLGENSGVFRELSLNYIQHKNKLYTAPDIFNHYYCNDSVNRNNLKPMSHSDTFGVTIPYLGSYLKRKGLNFDFVNSFNSEKEKLADLLKNNNILCIAITTTFYILPYPILEVINFIRRYNNTAKIIVGGPFIHSNSIGGDEQKLQGILNAIDADYYINSAQGESALVDIIQCVKNNQPVDMVNNIYYRGIGKYIPTMMIEECNKLEENHVDWGYFTDKLTNFVTLRTSSSCPFHCAFCSYPQVAGKYQAVSVEAIERELDAIKSTGKVKYLNFIDDTFNVPPERFKEILRMMIRNKYDFEWHSFFRCQYADREIIELMKESGCQGVFLGIESGSEKMLKNMNKVATIEKYKNGIALLNEYNILSIASFLIGFPGETEETVQETIDFFEETKPTFVRGGLWYCDPVSPVYKNKDKYKLRGSYYDWEHETMDVNVAADMIFKTFMSIKKSIWIPMYNYDYMIVFYLLIRGMSIDQIKDFINSFNFAIREKIQSPGLVEASESAMERIRRAASVL